MADQDNNIPKGFYKRGKIWWFAGHKNGKRSRFSTRQSDINRAVAWAREHGDYLSMPRDKRVSGCTPITMSMLKRMITDARIRSNKRAQAFSITIESIESLHNSCGGKCAVTGITFSTEKFGFSRAPFAPSLDRIDNTKGYVMGNCRLVCVAVNVAMSDFGEELFKFISAACVVNNIPHVTPHATFLYCKS